MVEYIVIDSQPSAWTRLQVLEHQRGYSDEFVCTMSSRNRDPESAEKDRSDRKERKHKHKDRGREDKSRHRSAEAPTEEPGGSHPHRDTSRVSSTIFFAPHLALTRQAALELLQLQHTFSFCFLAGARATLKQT